MTEHPQVFLIVAAMIVIFLTFAFIMMIVFLLIARPWMRAVSNGVPLSFFTIVGMLLRGDPPTLLIDAYVALLHDRVETSIKEVERTYIVNRTRVRTSQDLVELVKRKTGDNREPRTA